VRDKHNSFYHFQIIIPALICGNKIYFTNFSSYFLTYPYLFHDLITYILKFVSLIVYYINYDNFNIILIQLDKLNVLKQILRRKY